MLERAPHRAHARFRRRSVGRLVADAREIARRGPLRRRESEAGRIALPQPGGERTADLTRLADVDRRRRLRVRPPARTPLRDAAPVSMPRLAERRVEVRLLGPPGETEREDG